MPNQCHKLASGRVKARLGLKPAGFDLVIPAGSEC